MKKYYTTAINMTRLLVKIYHDKGLVHFKTELKEFCELTVKNAPDDHEEIGKRLTSIASMLFSSLLDENRETIMEHVITVSNKMSEIRNHTKKIKYVVEYIEHNLSKKEEKSDLLSEQILSYLKSCSLDELKQMTPDTLSETFNYSRHYIPKKFSEEQGYSVHNAIIYEKMNRAFQILSDPDNTLAVKDIAHQLGFTDARYFSDLFKTKFGKTPSAIIREST